MSNSKVLRLAAASLSASGLSHALAANRVCKPEPQKTESPAGKRRRPDLRSLRLSDMVLRARFTPEKVLISRLAQWRQKLIILRHTRYCWALSPAEKSAVPAYNPFKE